MKKISGLLLFITIFFNVLIFNFLIIPVSYVQAAAKCACCDGTTIPATTLSVRENPSECIEICRGHSGADYLSIDGQDDLIPVSNCILGDSSTGATNEESVARPSGPLIGFANPLCPSSDTPCDIESILGRVIKVALGIAGSVALAMFVFGGFVWMTASGEQKRIQLATDILKWSGIGLVVIFASYIMVKFILEQVV